MFTLVGEGMHRVPDHLVTPRFKLWLLGSVFDSLDELYGSVRAGNWLYLSGIRSHTTFYANVPPLRGVHHLRRLVRPVDLAAVLGVLLHLELKTTTPLYMACDWLADKGQDDTPAWKLLKWFHDLPPQPPRRRPRRAIE